MLKARSAFGYNYGAKQIVLTDDDGKTITIAATLGFTDKAGVVLCFS